MHALYHSRWCPSEGSMAGAGSPLWAVTQSGVREDNRVLIEEVRLSRQQEHVDLGQRRGPLDLFSSVVPPGVATQGGAGPVVVRRAAAAAEAGDDDSAGEQPRLTVAQVAKTGQRDVVSEVLEPVEVLVVALDEQRWPGRRPTLPEPAREVAGAVVLPRRSVDPVWVGPDAEVTHVEHLGEAHTERCLKSEDVVVKPVHGSMGASFA